MDSSWQFHLEVVCGSADQIFAVCLPTPTHTRDVFHVPFVFISVGICLRFWGVSLVTEPVEIWFLAYLSQLPCLEITYGGFSTVLLVNGLLTPHARSVAYCPFLQSVPLISCV